MVVLGDALKYILLKGFGIREGEILRAVLMQLSIFLVICSLLIVKPTVNALFLSKFGAENLPKAFVLVAIFAAFVSTLYSRLLPRVPLNKIIAYTLLSSVFTLIVFGLLLRFKFLEGWVLYLFYVWVAIFAVLSASQFWIMANIVFNVREAKRLFGFIGAGAIAGGIFGGYLTSILAPIIGSENLLFVCALLLSICIPIFRYVWKHFVESTQTHFQQKKRADGFRSHPFKLIKSSKHLTYLASITGVSVIVAKLVDYQFSAIAAATITQPDELTAFFGFWFSNLNLVSLAVQLFITRRVVGVFGVGTSLFFLPGAILIGATLLLFVPELWAAIFIKISDGSLKQSINKAAFELLALPIPLEVKKQTKTFIDVFIDSIATGIGGLILIFLVSGLELSTRFISFIIIGLIMIWGYFAIKVRKEYIQSFKIKVDQVKGAPDKKTPDFTSESVINGLKKVLEEGSEKQILFVLDKIREIYDERFFETVKNLLPHPSGAVRASAIRNLYYFKKNPIPAEIHPFIDDPDQRVKVQAFEYLIEHEPESRKELLDNYLSNDDYRVSGAALVSLAVETRDNPALRQSLLLEQRMEEKLGQIVRVENMEKKKFFKISILKAIGRGQLKKFYPVIGQFFEDEEPEVVRQAIIAAGATLSPGFTEPLIRFLSDKTHAATARMALSGFGTGIINELNDTINRPETSIEICRQIPAVVENIDSQKVVDFLFGLLDYDDLNVHLEALRSLNTLKIQFPHLRFHKKRVIRRILEEARLYMDTLSALYAQASLKSGRLENGNSDQRKKQQEARKSLIFLLERRLDGNLERIFRLLGLKYPPEDILSIYKGLQSEKPDLRVNAIEFLDNLLEANLQKVLIPIVETAMLDTISEEAIKNLDLKVPNEYQCFEMLLQGKDPKVKLAVLFLIAQLKEKRYFSLVEKYTNSPNLKVRTFAINALQSLRDFEKP